MLNLFPETKILKEVKPVEKPIDSNIYETITKFAIEEINLTVLLATTAIFIYLRKRLYNYVKRNFFYNYYLKDCSLNSQIRVNLVEILKDSNCDRVLLLQFHNGEKFLNNVSLIRVTLTHQVTKSNITLYEDIQSIPLSFLGRELEIINSVKMTWVYSDSTYTKCADYLKAINVKLYGAILLRNNFGTPIGILGLHYCSNDFDDALTEEVRDKILTLSDELVNLLSPKTLF